MIALRRTQTLWVAAVGLTAVLLGVAWHYRRLAHAAESELAAVRVKQALASANLQTSQRRLAEADGAREKQRAILKELSAPSAAPTTTASSSRVDRGPTIDERLRTEPDTQLYWLASQRSESAAKYRAFFRQAELSPAQIEQFHAVVIQHREKVMDLTAIVQAQGRAKPDDATAKLLAAADSDLKSAQRELLGESSFLRFAEYERTSNLRELVSGVAGGAVVVAREPWSAQQTEQLLQVMANASASYRGGGAASTGDIDWDAVDVQARMLLSPVQYTLFSTMEPPLPLGAKFQSQLYREVTEAHGRDASAKSKAKPAGG